MPLSINCYCAYETPLHNYRTFMRSTSDQIGGEEAPVHSSKRTHQHAYRKVSTLKNIFLFVFDELMDVSGTCLSFNDL